jgi:hypothetical protein
VPDFPNLPLQLFLSTTGTSSSMTSRSGSGGEGQGTGGDGKNLAPVGRQLVCGSLTSSRSSSTERDIDLNAGCSYFDDHAEYIKEGTVFVFIDGDADPAEADDHIDDTEDIEETENGGSSSIVGQKRQDLPI